MKDVNFYAHTKIVYLVLKPIAGGSKNKYKDISCKRSVNYAKHNINKYKCREHLIEVKVSKCSQNLSYLNQCQDFNPNLILVSNSQHFIETNKR